MILFINNIKNIYLCSPANYDDSKTTVCQSMNDIKVCCFSL